MRIQANEGGVSITVRVRPRSKPGFALADGELVIRVAAAPVAGRATAEAARALAGVLGVPATAVSLRTGGRSRMKVFRVVGVGPEEAARRLESALAEAT